MENEMTCNHNCNQGRSCDCVANEEYASSTNSPDANRLIAQLLACEGADLVGYRRNPYETKMPITMEENPAHELLRDVKRYVINALAGIGILATIAFIGMVSAGYFGK